MPLRFLFLLPLVLLLAGCGWPSAREAPAAEPLDRTAATTITVFSDGFHSGLILREADMPFDVALSDEVVGKAPADWVKKVTITPDQAHFVEVGFSEERWGTGEDRSKLHAARLLFWSGEGCMFVQYLPHDERLAEEKQSRIRVDLQINRQALTLLQQDLLAWIDQDRPCWRALHITNCYILPTRYNYTLAWGNCHDWTARTLRHIGFPIPESIVRDPGIFEDELRETAERVKRLGIAVVGPGLVPPPERTPLPEGGG